MTTYRRAFASGQARTATKIQSGFKKSCLPGVAALGADGGVAISQQGEQADGKEADGDNDLPRLEATAS